MGARLHNVARFIHGNESKHYSLGPFWQRNLLRNRVLLVTVKPFVSGDEGVQLIRLRGVSSHLAATGAFEKRSISTIPVHMANPFASSMTNLTRTSVGHHPVLSGEQDVAVPDSKESPPGSVQVNLGTP